MLKQAEKLPADQRPLRILLAAHPYVIHDPYIGEPITSMLENLEVCTLYSDRFDRKLALEKVMTFRNDALDRKPRNHWNNSSLIRPS